MKFYDIIGYGEEVEVSPGVYDKVITERKLYGDIIRNSGGKSDSDKVNPDRTVTNSISVVADAFAYEHFDAIEYVRWLGRLWIVSNVDVEPPRLVMRLGDVYDGPTPEPTPAPI